MSETQVRTIRSMMIMDQNGHTSLGWDPEDDQWVLPMIQRKMDEGYTFWIVQRNPLREEQLRRVSDIGGNRHVVLRDNDSRELFEQGHIGLLRDDAGEPGEEAGPEPAEAPARRSGWRRPLEALRRARTAAEAASADTVAHQPLKGG